MGGSFGGLLAGSGQNVTLLDTWQEHIDTINRDGLQISGALGEHHVKVPAFSTPQESGWADMAVIFTDANSTAAAAQTAAGVLKADAFAITFQNGIGNIEKLQQVLGKQRVLGGSSMCSAAMRGPGHSVLTHVADNTIGETDGNESGRLHEVKSLLEGAGFKVKTDPDIMTKIWSKFVLNCCINALCATSGLRQGELARLPELDALQSKIIDEVLAVTAAKGITMPDPDMRSAIKKQCWRKFSKPSMLQHVEAGKKTEIDALNGALVREAQSLGIAVPYNESLVALLKGRELHQQRAIHEPDLDYAAWEAEVNAQQQQS
jgi:2-dehydropantoate 2-reductase